MKNLNVVNADFNTEIGFFWVEFENGKSVQCCLDVRKDGNGYAKRIDRNDNGSNWGLCADTNEWAVNEDGSFDDINATMFKEARKLGLRVF